MTKIIVCGCFGRLGSVIGKLAEQDAAMELVAGVDITSPGGGLTYPVFTDIGDCTLPADALVICLPPHAATYITAQLHYAAVRAMPVVLCTTGLRPEVMEEIKKAAESTAVLVSANMALGINLLANMLSKAARLLYDANFDIEIIERHHNQKLDAPSGTAYLLADTANAALGGQMRIVCDRSSNRTPRQREEIGMHALRGGSITGEHTVVFAGLDEVIELTHIAQSRDVFAVGALKAARFIKGKPAGYYTMQDVIENP
ncbi:MAG: 4-hydroxy-tetrahydrodipicolinate reductase [Defluviitaleaceae bacterium]|nr:4-hydroxy-tetrahydrodipicolinate reductase [Defluviitaleaceae bacterium]MCL2240020.1 4-hydroxy-tetrahydrodipicolinate reductase [Defluviitaleaceae bacterium]MCL2240687.1 4-hydroxy-tetrahydrodipicolinate reductase [Defluviitaleaceae bacterium]